MARDSIGTVNMKMVFNADEFVSGLNKADRELTRTLAKMEKETGRTAAQIRQSLARGPGGRFMSGAELASEQAASVRESYQKYATGGIGQEMVAPRIMGEADLRAMQEANHSMIKLGKAGMAVRAAIAGTAVMAKVFRGDAEGAANALKSIPILGSVASEVEGILGDITGITAETERWKNAVEGINREWDITVKTMEKAATTRKRIRQHDVATTMAMTEERERPFFKLKQDFESWDRVAKSEEEKAAVRRRYFAEYSNLIDAYVEKADEEAQARVDVEMELNRKLQEQAKERFKKEEDRRKDLLEQLRNYTRVVGDIEETRLRISGRKREAELAAIRNHYNEQIKMAKDAGKIALAIKLGELRDLSIAEKSKLSPAGAQIQSKYAATGSIQHKQLTVQEKMLIEQQNTNRILAKGVKAVAQ